MSITVLGDHLQFTKLHLEVQGGLVAVKREVRAVDKVQRGGTRGIVTEFSPASRKRLMRKGARIAAGRATFLTLTYPKRFPSGKDSKNHLRAFLERIRRRHPNASGLWRLEYQQRGAPHFHLILYNLPFIPFWKLRAWWADIISDYVDQQRPFIRINYLTNDRAVKRYVSKYVAKSTDDPKAEGRLFNNGSYLHDAAQGRWWGVFNSERIPWAPQVWITVEQVTDTGLKRILARLSREWEGIDPTWQHGVCVFSNFAYLAWLDCLVLARQDMPACHSTIEVRNGKQLSDGAALLDDPAPSAGGCKLRVRFLRRIQDNARASNDGRNHLLIRAGLCRMSLLQE